MRARFVSKGAGAEMGCGLSVIQSRKDIHRVPVVPRGPVWLGLVTRKDSMRWRTGREHDTRGRSADNNHFGADARMFAQPGRGLAGLGFRGKLTA